MTNKMFPSGTQPQVKIFKNGDTEYITPLPEVEVIGHRADIDLGPNADFNTYYEWYLKQLREGAHDRAEFTRCGYAPLRTKATDTNIIEGSELKEQRRRFGDTIQYRHDTDFYFRHPALESWDSVLYKRMEEPMSGYSCINSNTSYFGTEYSNMSNLRFAQNPRGFKEVSLDSLERGDIVQLHQPWQPGYEGLRPFHTVMVNGYDENGDIRTWNQFGAIGLVTPQLRTYLHSTPDQNGLNIPRVLRGYRFVGDENTIAKARAEYQAYQERNASKKEE